MRQIIRPSVRAVPIALVLAATLCWSAASAAQTVPAPAAPAATEPAPLPSTDVIRLTDEQRMAILDGNTVESAAAARGEQQDSTRTPLNIHGEVGAMIGSNGTRAIYGAAAIPLGDNAGAVVSFESSRFGYPRRR